MTHPTVQTEPVTRLFTFGYGQTCPFTGKDLGDHYALVTAPDRSAALLTMQATFGRNWAFEYAPDSVHIVDYIPRMTLHAHLVLGVEIETPEPEPTGVTIGRGEPLPPVEWPHLDSDGNACQCKDDQA